MTWPAMLSIECLDVNRGLTARVDFSMIQISCGKILDSEFLLGEIR